MRTKNSLLAGILGGSVLPGLSLFIFLYLLKGNYMIMNKPGVPYWVAVCINLFIIRYCFVKGMEKTGTGFIVITFIFTVAVFILKLQPIQ